MEPQQANQEQNPHGRNLGVQHARIQHHLDTLSHASNCQSSSCDQFPDCAKMKQVLEHTRECRRKTSGGCGICIKFMNICCYHARRCEQEECTMPLCRPIKLRLQQRDAERRLQQQQQEQRQDEHEQDPAAAG